MFQLLYLVLASAIYNMSVLLGIMIGRRLEPCLGEGWCVGLDLLRRLELALVAEWVVSARAYEMDQGRERIQKGCDGGQQRWITKVNQSGYSTCQKKI